MNWGIDLAQKSTRLGLFVMVFSALSVIGWWFDKDLTPLVAAGTFIAGLLGFARTDV